MRSIGRHTTQANLYTGLYIYAHIDRQMRIIQNGIEELNNKRERERERMIIEKVLKEKMEGEREI